MLCKERSSPHLLLCPAQSSNMSMHALHRKCCTRISSGSRSKSCAHYAFMQFATSIQYKHALQRKRYNSHKVFTKFCCPSCVACSHHVCCLPDTLPGCVFSSPVQTAECWKMHVMCQVTLQSSLSLFELWASRQSSVVWLCRKILVYNSGNKLPEKDAYRKSLLVGLQAATNISAEHNCTNPQRNQVRIKTVNSTLNRRHSVPLFSPSRHQKSDRPCSPRDSAQM